jgi:hypothetical protein
LAAVSGEKKLSGILRRSMSAVGHEPTSGGENTTAALAHYSNLTEPDSKSVILVRQAGFDGLR